MVDVQGRYLRLGSIPGVPFELGVDCCTVRNSLTREPKSFYVSQIRK